MNTLDGAHVSLEREELLEAPVFPHCQDGRRLVARHGHELRGSRHPADFVDGIPVDLLSCRKKKKKKRNKYSKCKHLSTIKHLEPSATEHIQ